MTEIITLADIRFRWQTAGPLVLDVPSLSVTRGERVFLNGPSGSGKTTLLNLLGGVTVPLSGRITILDQQIDQMTRAGRDRFRSAHVGFIFQQFNLLPYLDLIANVTLPCQFSAMRKARIGASPEAEARRLLGHMQLDVDRLQTRPVAELSVGQQQRVAAARALIGAPDLIIADEPTSSIDAGAREAFLELLFAEAARTGATILLVSHDAALDRLFDRSLALTDINRAA